MDSMGDGIVGSNPAGTERSCSEAWYHAVKVCSVFDQALSWDGNVPDRKLCICGSMGREAVS